MTTKYLAALLQIPESDVKESVKLKAERLCAAEDPQNRTYWDALAHSGQMHGNIPKGMAVALVYNFLTQD